MTSNAISRRIKRKVKNINGYLVKNRWTIHNNIWNKTDLATVRGYLTKLDGRVNPKDYALRGDIKRMAIPQQSLSNKSIQNSQRLTKKLFPKNTKIGDTYALITHTGAERQSFHTDTDKKEGSSVIHAITKRYIWIRDNRGEHLIKMNAGDILVMHGDCCHAGAENPYSKKSYALFLPVDYPLGSTFACRLQPENLSY